MTERSEGSEARGFTLVETMVTIVIVSVGILAMASLLVSNMKANRGSEMRFNVAAISESILAEYQSQYSAGTWDPDANSGVTAVTKADSGFGVAYTVTATAITGGYMVEVEIVDDRLSTPFTNHVMILTWL